MKEIQKKIKIVINWCIIFSVPVILGLVGYTIYYNIKNNKNCFWSSSIIEILTLLVAIVFAYYFVERKNDKRKQKEIIEKNIKKLQSYIYNEEIYCITSKENITSLTRSIKIRKINNLITYLNDYAKIFNFEKQINELSKKFAEYRKVTETMSEDDDFSEKSKNNVIRIIETIDDILEEIMHKIYL